MLGIESGWGRGWLESISLLIEVRKGFSEEVTLELRPERGAPSHVEESEGKHQAEG